MGSATAAACIVCGMFAMARPLIREIYRSDGAKDGGGGGEITVCRGECGCARVGLGGFGRDVEGADLGGAGFWTFSFNWELVLEVPFATDSPVLDVEATGSLGGLMIFTGAFLGRDELRDTPVER